MTEFGNWLLEQTPERAKATLEHLHICQLLGEAERRAPSAPETLALRSQVEAFYKRWDDEPAPAAQRARSNTGRET